MPLPPVHIVMEEVTDREEIAKFQARWTQAERNSAWLQAHAQEIYRNYRGQFIVVAGEELLARPSQRRSRWPEAAHPEDEGYLTRYISPQKMVRIYAD